MKGLKESEKERKKGKREERRESSSFVRLEESLVVSLSQRLEESQQFAILL